jgi:hypothetical protein
MGIAGVEPRQLAPTVGMTGSGSTDSPAPSPTIADRSTPTRFDGSSLAIAIDSASPIDTTIDPLTINFDTNISVNLDSTSTINIGIAVPTVIDIAPPEAEVDIARSTIIDTASPSITDLTLVGASIDPASSPAGAVSVGTGGFDMAFELFNFHVAELISVSDSTPPAADTSTSPAIGDAPSTIEPPAPSEEEPRLETSNLSVG